MREDKLGCCYSSISAALSRTSEIRRGEFNSSLSGTALVPSIVSSTADRCLFEDERDIHAGRQGACLLSVRRCWCAAWRHVLPHRYLSPPSCRHQLTKLSVIAGYATPIGRRRGSDGRSASINGRWLIVAWARAYWSRRIFSEAPSATAGALILSGFLGISNESVATTRTNRARGRKSPCTTTVVNRTPESWTGSTIHVSAGAIVGSLDTARTSASRLGLALRAT